MKPATSTDVVFLAAKRTPFGTFGGALRDQSATDLAVHASRAALAEAGVAPEHVGHVVLGNVAQTSPDAIYLARHVGLRAGVPIPAPALTVNRLCGSGFEAVVQAARLLAAGEAEVVLAGGTESMSQAPLVVRGTRWGWPLGKPPPMEDMLWSALTDSYANMPMALTAEKLAEQYGIGQDAVDEYAVTSQRRFAAAQEAGRLAAEIAPMELPSKKGPVRFAKDEHNRPDTTVESLRKLPKVFKKDGVIHAGAASGICDGAGALVMATRAWADQHGKKPLARLVNWGHAGVDPTIMGIGPVPAFRNAMARAEAKLADFDLFEVNEAFAPQYLAVEKELGLPRDRSNVDGGAIAVGHPLAASGARITMHLVHELRRRGARYGLGGACIGGGQGVAVIVEAL
ncbi:MAG TPA: acetyl-CoA C-acetyltransferase [Anaeromyxobacteraceae bacterium]|nr:acetyl-CoA C-acetyltransferase [Anaeromyxobacteraceae bacterium]